MPRTRNGLLPKQQRFVEEYLIDLNATQAAIRAGYSARHANKIGPELLGKTRCAQAIARAQDLRTKAAGIRANQFLLDLALLAYSDIGHYDVDTDGKLLLTPEAPPGASRAVSSFRHKKRVLHKKNGDTVITYATEIKLWDKIGAMQMLGQYLNVLGKGADKIPPERQQATLNIYGPILVAFGEKLRQRLRDLEAQEHEQRAPQS